MSVKIKSDTLIVNVSEYPVINQLIIIENVLGLESGDEIGLFDTNAQLSFGNCDSQIGELLVGAGIYTGEQLEIVGVGSLDACDFGGYLLPGWVADNPITIFLLPSTIFEPAYRPIALLSSPSSSSADSSLSSSPSEKSQAPSPS